MIDITAAFDTVLRKELLQQLENLLESHKMRMLDLLINEVKLQIRVGNVTGKSIVTNIGVAQGVAQGDCLSTLHFILYLAHFIKPIFRETV